MSIQTQVQPRSIFDLPQFFQNIGKTLSRWAHNYKTRRQLRGMDHHLLEDIGVDRKSAEKEGRKLFWL